MTEPLELELSVIAPCYNEELNVRELARRVVSVFQRGNLRGELVLVNDGSRDNTKTVIEEMEAAYPGVVVGQHHGVNQGITGAWKTGARAARAPAVAIIDADLQYQPEDLLRLYRTLLESNVDIVQGWRSAVGRERGTRYHLSRGLNTILNATFGMKLQDNKSGFLVTSKEILEDLLTYDGSYYYWQSFIMVAAHAKGYSYKQIETLFENRRAGTSFLDGNAYRAAVRSLVDVGRATWEYRVTNRPPDTARQFLRRNPPRFEPKPRSPAKQAHWKGYMKAFNATHWMITKDVEDYYESLNRSQWLTRSQLRELQDEKLRRLVRHAYRNVPYYRERMRERGLTPQDIRGQADLHKLPFLTKKDIREHLFFDILSENHDKNQVLKISTSGSTGEPFVCYADRAQLEFRWAATLRSQEWTGYEFGDPCVRLWHQTLGMSKSQAAREIADAKLCRRKFIPIFEMSDAKLQAMVREIAEWQPVLMDGYAEALDFLAHYLKEVGNVDVRPTALMSSAQTLPDQSRKLIEEAFGCKVFDKYGSREFSGLAYECSAHTGHHIVGEGYIVEVLKEGRPVAPGEVGEVVITDLNNYCLPFIRYRIGDLAEAMDPDFDCPCGRGLPLVGKIEGRVQSIIQGTDKRYLPGTFFAHYLKEFDHAIRRFQVVQERPNAMIFRVVKGERYSDDSLQEILATFRHYLGEDMSIDVDFVENIELVRTGKRLAAVSRLNVDFQGDAPEINSELN
ncbi:MAG: glycosyltransferase [Myxococcales bacterium]|nr:glycosyltransferase [Myxococcales bacterium]